jgi:hypothetical protein
MTRPVYKLVFVAALVVAGSASRSPAQAPIDQPYYPELMALQLQRGDPIGGLPMIPQSDAGSMAPAPTPNFLEGWPRPAEQPPSLFRQASAPQYGCDPLPGRYFEYDPLLDPPSFPQPGFIADVEVQAAAPHILHSRANGVPVGPNPPNSIVVPVSGLNWTASPQVELGYRLPSGFGEFLVNWRYIGTSGSSTTPFGPDGPASLQSRLNFNLVDIDYASREFTPWQHWGMQWRLGVRGLYMNYDTQLTQPFAAAAAGSGILQNRATNSYEGWGGHVGVELNRDLNQFLPGLDIISKLDFGSTIGTIKQGVSQITTGGPNGFGGVQNGQASPSLSAQLGLNYHPPGTRVDLYVGGFYEYWWNIGALENFSPISRGELSVTGVTFRLAYNY